MNQSSFTPRSTFSASTTTSFTPRSPRLRLSRVVDESEERV